MVLQGQIAMVSGGLGDIGAAIALELARAGAAIALGDLVPTQKGHSLFSQLKKIGVQHRYDLVDVTDAAQVRAWVTAVERSFGVPTLIVPNAATVTLAGIEKITPEQWSRELSVNLTGAFLLAQAAALRLVHHGRPGRIVFIGSWAAHRPHQPLPAYCVAKAGLRMLMKCMALEFARHGILVNEVAPGYVDAGLSRKVWESDPVLRQRDVGKVPVQRLIDPAEVAQQVAWLCHPNNLNATGSTVLVDGGLSLLA